MVFSKLTMIIIIKTENRKKYLYIELTLAPPSPKYEKDTDKREFGDNTDMTT